MNTKISILVGLLCWGFGGTTPVMAATPIAPKVIHLLNRLSFGPRPGDLETVEKIGIEAYIQQQLHPDTIAQPPTLTANLAQLETIGLSPLQLFAQTHLPKMANEKTLTPEQKKAYRQQEKHVLEQARQANLLQATSSPRQLQEVMVNFWYNHFNVFADKGNDKLLVGAYEQTAIRPYALGRFRDLLGATAHDPAMLIYLDNWRNTAPTEGGTPSRQPGPGRQPGLNENYARELMELHTLGVDGGYTQQDVIALAKIFTGWTFRRSAQVGVGPNGFYFDAKRHDFSDKLFLGHTIKGSGMAEGEQALDILAKSPATARHISYKLVQTFVADQPPPALVDKLTQQFLSSDGDIAIVLSTLFRDSEFWDSRYYRAKFKTPYQYVVSALRATDRREQDFRLVNGFLNQLGMPLYGCPTPDGYKNTADPWMNPDAITRRISFATGFASGRGPLSDPTIAPIDAVQLANTLGNSFSAQTQQTIEGSPATLHPALMLGSPEFMRY